MNGPDFLATGTAILAFLIALITTGVMLRKHIMRPINNQIKRQLVEVIEETVQPHLEYIRAELSYDHGRSVKDQVRDMRTELAVVRKEINQLR